MQGLSILCFCLGIDRQSSDELEGTPILILLLGDSRDKLVLPSRMVTLGTLQLLFFHLPISPIALLQFLYAIRLIDIISYAFLMLVLIDDLDDVWIQILNYLLADLVALHRSLPQQLEITFDLSENALLSTRRGFIAITQIDYIRIFRDYLVRSSSTLPRQI